MLPDDAVAGPSHVQPPVDPAPITLPENLPSDVMMMNCQIHEDDCLYLAPIKFNDWMLTPRQQLTKTRSRPGEAVLLEAEFRSKVLGSAFWYRNEQRLNSSKRILLSTDEKTARCLIKGARLADSGLYFVVARTQFGVTSSFADVVVELEEYDEREMEIKCFENPPTERYDAFEFEIINLKCRAPTLLISSVTWFKDDTVIEDNRSTTYINYGSGFFALKLIAPRKSSSGRYRCSAGLHNEEFNIYFADVEVKEGPKNMSSVLPYVGTKIYLRLVMASVGSAATFNCTFNLIRTDMFECEWHVGVLKVKEHMDKFIVYRRRGEFKLMIPHVTREMAGPVVCELRARRPQDLRSSSYYVTQLRGYLCLAPPQHLDLVLRELRQEKPTCNFVYHYLNIVCGDQALIRLDYTGVPRPSITWIKDDEIIEPGQKEWQSFNIDEFADHVILYIDHIGMRDCGLVKALVENEAGTCMDEVMVTVSASKRLMNSPYVAPYLATNLEPHANVSWHEETFWPREMILGKAPWWFVLEMERQGRFEFLLETLRTDVDVGCLQRGRLYKFRFRIVTYYSTSPPSEIATCLIGFGTELDPPMELEMLLMLEYKARYKSSSVMELGAGSYGVVRLVTDKYDRKFAAKELLVRHPKKKQLALNEFDILKRLRHDKILRIHEAFFDKERVVLVTEYLSGGELFSKLLAEESFSEKDTIYYVKQICEGVAYMHHQQVAHLDLKAENIMCVSKDQKFIKIIDFGLAHVLTEGTVDLRAMYGTKDYISPEIIKFDPISFKSDCWSVGVLTYILLSGTPPFDADDWPATSTLIQNVEYDYEDMAFESVTDLAKDFIDKLLVENPEKRMSAMDCLRHRWLADEPPHVNRIETIRDNLHTYLENYRAKWHKAGMVLIAAHRLRVQVERKSRKELEAKRLQEQLMPRELALRRVPFLYGGSTTSSSSTSSTDLHGSTAT